MVVPSDIGVIIVCYNPTEDDVRNVSAIATAYKGAVADNSSCPAFAGSQVGIMQYIFLGGNKGIAGAQNVALRHLLRDEKIRYVVFLDQDSRTDMGYPQEIVGEYKRVSQANHHLAPSHASPCKLALLGPTVDNIKSGEEYHSVIHTDREAEDGFVPRRDVISSGSVISREALEEVGLNDSSLFIDFVDFEWCWRAESRGYVCGITRNVHISHQVGCRELSFGSYKVIISAPVRYFYQYRNHLWLCRRGYVPLQWKIATGIKHFARLLYFPLFVKGGIACWRKMLKGVAASFHRQIIAYE